jgi:hypothetical protein
MALDRLVQSLEVVAFERHAAETAAAIRARIITEFLARFPLRRRNPSQPAFRCDRFTSVRPNAGETECCL